MKADVDTELGKSLDIREHPVPQIGAGQVRVRVLASGVCHTDLHVAMEDGPVKPTSAFVPGHEDMDEIVALGAAVTHLAVTPLKTTGRACPGLHTACGRSEHCTGGLESLCDSRQGTGYSVDGAYADYVGPLPDGFDFEPAPPVLCARVTVCKGVKETEVRPGQWVAILGIGGLGHVAVQYAMAMGIHAVAVDIAESKLKLAKSLGTDEVINAADVDPVKEVISQIGGLHGALVTAVSTKAFAQGTGILRRHGAMSLVGLPPDDIHEFFDRMHEGRIEGPVVLEI